MMYICRLTGRQIQIDIHPEPSIDTEIFAQLLIVLIRPFSSTFTPFVHNRANSGRNGFKWFLDVVEMYRAANWNLDQVRLVGWVCGWGLEKRSMRQPALNLSI